MPNVNAQHIAAVMLLDGGLTVAASHDYQRMADPLVVDLRRKIELRSGAAEQGTSVRVELVDGRVLVEQVQPTGGLPQPEDVQRKALELIGPLTGERAARELTDQVLRMEEVANVRSLRPALLAIRAGGA
jgi:2-methylcitrate dehydratase PrpD